MQKGFILRGGCSETDFQSTHHYCSTHEAIRITTQSYMRSVGNACTHSQHSVYVNLCLKTLSSIHWCKALRIKKQFSSGYNLSVHEASF